MKELLTTKNIVIASSVLVGIIAIFPITGYVRNELERRRFEQSIDSRIIEMNKELAPTKEKLSQSLLQNLKDKNRDNLRAMHCDPVAHRLHNITKEKFNRLWQRVEKEDYSEATIRFGKSTPDQRSQDLIVSNIKTEEGTKNRDFGVDDKGTYFCVAPIYRE